MPRTLTKLCVLFVIAAAAPNGALSQDPAKFTLNKGDHICYIGNTMADRMQHHAWLESMIHAAYPGLDLTFRNLGFGGDEIDKRQRSANFGDADQWLTKCKADVVFCFFGYNEALRGSDGKELAGLIDNMRKQKYNGTSAPRIVVFSPIAHEDLKSPHLPDGSANNEKLAVLTEGFKKVCAEKKVVFVDLFSATKKLYGSADKPLTMNGIHLLDHGNRAVAEVIVDALFGGAGAIAKKDVSKVRDAVQNKNLFWFSRYRVVDGYNVFGGRSRLSWHGQSNYDVMQREMAIFDVMTANRDKRIWGVAKGGDPTIDDSNIPKQLVVKTNRPGKLEGGKYPYISGIEGIAKMKMAKGMQANLFASEEMFPELINPVQMAVDTNGHLFASVWPTYPHWNPTKPRTDRIVCLPDENGDGVADKCIVFADKLNSVTGFEFWGGGILVFAPPEIWFLQDTDGDYKADKKIRMLQGISSADTHHSANAVVMGPDGWLYWSRGIFNVAAFETPTTTYRSGSSGVHRFNPRTFETEFHFPIGPNPHGDVFDQWGYQFANDGTGGTGSYVNIGKGKGNKKWFQKRVRPVPATGILSSSHFPEANNGNFLICNSIGFLGVLQHEVKYNGADITAEEIEPILVSSDPNFRPTDVEIGSDGALYVSDWANALIGHMQHNIRDPNRDHQHGRIYRVTYKGRPLIKPLRLKGKPIETVCQAFYAKENAARYRARLELSGRKTKDVVAQVGKWAAGLDPKKADDAQAMLECLWVFEEHRVPNIELLKRIYGGAEEEKVRAAAIRTLGHWAGRIEGGGKTLMAAGADPSALVRAEAIKAAAEFGGLDGAETIFIAATRPTDPEIEAVLNYARGEVKVDQLVQDALKAGKKLSPAAQLFMLKNASAKALLQMERSDAVYTALLSRASIPTRYRQEAIRELAKKSNRDETQELIVRLTEAENSGHASLADLAGMLTGASDEQLSAAVEAITKLATSTKSSAVRTAAYTAWIRTGRAKPAWDHASQTPHTLADLLNSLAGVENSQTRESLFALVRPLMFELPEHLNSSKGVAAGVAGAPVAFEYYEPHPANVAIETLNKLKPKLKGNLKKFELFVPKGRRDDFATKQTALLLVPTGGQYTFFTNSDDGSRLYINKQLVVNNDGKHGPEEKSGTAQLTAGLHEIVVTFFESGGGDALQVSWQGPGIKKQVIPASALRAVGESDMRSLVIKVVARWPGHFDDKVKDFAKLAAADAKDSPSAAALDALATLPAKRVVSRMASGDTGAVLAKLIARADKATPPQRQTNRYARLLALGDHLAAKNPDASKKLAALRSSIPERVDPKIMALGREVYHRDSHCATCHQPHGQGMPNLYPPLDGSLWATGSEDRMIRVVLDGMHGTIEVKGQTYRSPPVPPMTAFRHICSDEEIAAALTYVRNSWSNRAKPIDAKKVASVRGATAQRETFWEASELLALYPREDGRVSVTSKTSPGDWTAKFIKTYKYEDVKLAELDAKPRSFDTGQKFFTRLGCIQCHTLGGKGGSFGPDLTKLDAKKHNPEHILLSLIDPSKEVDEKYVLSTFVLDSGTVVTGLVTSEKDGKISVITNPLSPDKPTIVKVDEIDERGKAKASIMPGGTLNWLTQDEILDLIAYVLSRGDKKHKLYQGGK